MHKMNSAKIGLSEAHDFVQSARETCFTVENFDLSKTAKLLSVLIGLLRSADRLVSSGIEFADGDVEISHDISGALAAIPEKAVFHVVFDPLNSGRLCAVSLKDSIGDIYRSLKGGLDVLECGSVDSN